MKEAGILGRRWEEPVISRRVIIRELIIQYLLSLGSNADGRDVIQIMLNRGVSELCLYCGGLFNIFRNIIEASFNPCEMRSRNDI